MSDALSGIGNFFQGNGTAINGLLSAAGAGSNLFSGYENFQNTQNSNKSIANAESVLNDPKKLQAQVAAIQQPLSAGLTSGVENAVQGTEAEKGLATSPAAMQSVLAQALAPYIQQNQSTALQTIMQKLQAQLGIKPNMLPMTNMTSLLKMLSANNGSNGNTTGANPGEFDFSTIPSVDTSFLSNPESIDTGDN